MAKTTKRKESPTEGWFLKNAKEGTVFFSLLKDGNLTAKANYYERKIKTERLILMASSNPKNIEYITRVTILK